MATTCVLFSLLALEVALRCAAAYRDRNWQEFAVALEGARDPGRGHETTLGGLIRRVENPNLVYQLRPSLDVRFRGASVRTNARGHPDRTYSELAPKHTRRILGIGDSVMFGWGVEPEENYLYLLEEKLNRERPTKSWEILNTGVPGYNTVMEVEQLVQVADDFRPDLVLLGFIPNDLVLPVFLHRKPRHARLDRSYLLQALRPSRAPETLPKVEPSEVAPRFAHLVGEDSFLTAIERLREWSNSHDVPVVVAQIQEQLDPFAAQAFERAEFLMIDLWHQGLAEIERTRRTLPADGHPSPLAHALIAETLYSRLESVEVLQRLEAARE